MYGSKGGVAGALSDKILSDWLGPEFGMLFSALKGVNHLRDQTFIIYSGYATSDYQRASRMTLRPSKPADATWHHHEVIGVMQLIQTRYHSSSYGAGRSHRGGVLMYEILKNVEYK